MNFLGEVEKVIFFAESFGESPAVGAGLIFFELYAF